MKITGPCHYYCCYLMCYHGDATYGPLPSCKQQWLALALEHMGGVGVGLTPAVPSADSVDPLLGTSSFFTQWKGKHVPFLVIPSSKKTISAVKSGAFTQSHARLCVWLPQKLSSSWEILWSY